MIRAMFFNDEYGGGIGVSRTIKAQYYKSSLANFIRRDSLGATAVIEIKA
jgi:hypothetical protein